MLFFYFSLCLICNLTLKNAYFLYKHILRNTGASRMKKIHILLLFVVVGSSSLMHGSTEEEVLINASKNGNLQDVHRLLESGAEVDKVDDSKSTALHKASYGGYHDIVKILLEHGADVNKVDDRKSTALHEASIYGYHDIVKTLLAHGADVNKVDNRKLTALHGASYSEHHDIVKTLLEHGAEVIGYSFNQFPIRHQQINKLLKAAGKGFPRSMFEPRTLPYHTKEIFQNLSPEDQKIIRKNWRDRHNTLFLRHLAPTGIKYERSRSPFSDVTVVNHK